MMLAHRHGALLNASELATSFGISDHTARSYVDLLTEHLHVAATPAVA